MPAWMRALQFAGILSLTLASGVCQDSPDGQIAAYSRLAAASPASSLAHYRLAEAYLRDKNYQSAANEFREALNGDLDPAWTEAWSHIQLGKIFDLTGQHERAANEYRKAQQTGDNIFGALEEANNYLKNAKNGISVEPIQKTDPEYTDEARVAGLEGIVLLRAAIGEDGSPERFRLWNRSDSGWMGMPSRPQNSGASNRRRTKVYCLSPPCKSLLAFFYPRKNSAGI